MAVAPRRPRLPPLNALRAFEAAARLGGFAQAAEELGVTPAAISQRIRALEEWAGRPLFERRAHGVRLTEDAAALVPQVAAAFDLLGEASARMRAEAPRRGLSIAALPAVAQLWLPARLPALRAMLGGAPLSVHALETPPNLRRDRFDLSIFFRAPGPGLVDLAPDDIFPVCAPAMAARLTTPADLSRETLLHDETWSGDWALWSRATGAAPPDPRGGPRFSLFAVMAAEAKAGAGAMIAHAPLVESELASGALVRPFPGTAATGMVLAVECRPEDALARAAAETLRQANRQADAHMAP